ncbi:MAG: hypothetical protein ACM3JB_19750 [Acidobacteriaceae bacterium]
MSSTLKLSWLLLLALAAAAQNSAPQPSNFGFKNWTPDPAQWHEDPDAPGTFSQLVAGSPESGHWVMYVKVDPGAWIN